MSFLSSVAIGCCQGASRFSCVPGAQMFYVDFNVESFFQRKHPFTTSLRNHPHCCCLSARSFPSLPSCTRVRTPQDGFPARALLLQISETRGTLSLPSFPSFPGEEKAEWPLCSPPGPTLFLESADGHPTWHAAGVCKRWPLVLLTQPKSREKE